MFERLRLLIQLFRVGNELADPGKWKAGQIQANVLAGVIVTGTALLATFGVNLPIDTTSAAGLAAGVVAVLNIVLTAITSRRAGLLPAKPADQPGQGDPGQPGGLPGLHPDATAQSVQQPSSGPEPGAGLSAAAPAGPAPNIYVHLDESSQYLG